MALGRQIVNLVRLHFLHDPDEIGGIGQIAVVQLQFRGRFVRILINMVDAFGIEKRGASLDAMHLVAFGEQQFGEVGAVLAGDAGN